MMTVNDKTATTDTAGAEVKDQNQQGQEKKDVKADEELIPKSEHEKLLMTETDKRVQEALKTHRSKWEKEYRTKIEEERKDAERLAKLSAEERTKELVERQEKELTVKEQELIKRELKLTAIDVLSEEKLPVAFADQLLGKDADETYERIKKFKAAWHEAVEEEVNKRLKGKIPRDGEKDTKPVDMNKIIRSMSR